MNLIKNIENKIRLALYVSLGSFVSSIIIALAAFGYAYKMISREKNQIYVLDKNIPIVATRAEVGDNRAAEYKAHIEAFHDYFFSMPPDNEYIDYQIKRAMFLVDASGLAQYNTLKEQGYYTNLVSTSSVITCTKDSILLDMNTKRWRYYGKQKIERPSNITIRSLVTEGYLQDVPRSENNPHGALINGWKTLENKDLYNEAKQRF